jgi:hypothetical protein
MERKNLQEEVWVGKGGQTALLQKYPLLGAKGGHICSNAVLNLYTLSVRIFQLNHFVGGA